MSILMTKSSSKRRTGGQPKPHMSNDALKDRVLYRHTPPHTRAAALRELIKRAEERGYAARVAAQMSEDGGWD